MAGQPRLPSVVLPMLATPGPLPSGQGWTFEFKWDGVRAVVALAGAKVRAVSRNGRDVTGSYPELRTMPAQVAGRRMLLDGELVALDPSGAPSFALLQHRMHVRAPDARLLERVPVRYYVFDLLLLDDTATVGWSYRERRDALESIDFGVGSGSVPPRFDTDGQSVMDAAVQHGLEGVVAKRATSGYEPGHRSRSWIKTPLNVTTEVVIAGWRPGEGRRTGQIGSLILGAYDDEDQFVHVGQVGTGFTAVELRRLAEKLDPLEQPSTPFDMPPSRQHVRGARWVRPTLVGEVVYRTLTPDGRLRHPSWRGLRPDREPVEVRTRTMR
ncbi:MAG: non-homologous end-joining DNA ligase [Micromonosporaceae bacterium]